MAAVAAAVAVAVALMATVSFPLRIELSKAIGKLQIQTETYTNSILILSATIACC